LTIAVVAVLLSGRTAVLVLLIVGRLLSLVLVLALRRTLLLAVAASLRRSTVARLPVVALGLTVRGVLLIVVVVIPAGHVDDLSGIARMW